MFTVQSIHIAFLIWGGIFCLIAALCLFFTRRVLPGKNKLLMYMELSTALLLFMDALAWAYRGYPGKVGYYMVRISNFIVFLDSDWILFLFHSYVCWHIFGEESAEKKPRRVKLVYWICAAGMGLVVFSQFTDLYYYFDADNFYHRNSMFPLSLAVCLVSMVLELSLLIQYRSRMKYTAFLSMLSYIVLPIVATVALAFCYGISLANIAINISMIIMFTQAMAEQSRLLAEREKELCDLRIDILLSQIRPHFIYNVLTTIKHLCKTDQQQAAETVDDLSGYLRGNLDSLSIKEPIPIERELNHVKSYLSIEKKRFGDRIQVCYDIRENGFFVPALTVQPLVENAVKHGITRKISGGNIYISTVREKAEYVIRVEDDGVGFDDDGKQENTDKGHVGINNVRNRVESMCGGTLTVYSRPGEGTRAEIRIPAK